MLNADVLNAACPDASSGTVASNVAPSLKLTEPVGVPGAEFVELTVAVKVTNCPKLEGLDEEVRLTSVPF